MKHFPKAATNLGGQLSRLAICALVLGLAACTSVRAPSKSDPLEGLNRTIFEFNDTVDRFALQPVARAYNWTLPKAVRISVSNFFSNLGDVSVMVNNLLQGKITAGTEDLMRISINSLFGVAGLFDVASVAGLPKHQADLGLTLGYYGVATGPYLVLPILGPSTLRDAAGLLVIGREVDPMSYIDPVSLRNQLYGVRVVNARAALLQANDLLEDAALDKYSFVRNAYLQRRQYLIYDGNPPPPDYDDEEEDLPIYEDPEESAASDPLAPKKDAVKDKRASDRRVPAQQVMPPLRNFPNLRF